MKINKKIIIICLSIIIIYTFGVSLFGYKNSTIKNTKLHAELTEKPRLEDDFYNYINYDKLSQVLIDESKVADSWTYYNTYQKQIDDEKKKIIDNIVSKCDMYSNDSVYKKMCNYYNYLKNTNYDENKKILDEYINIINSSNNIDEFQKNIFTVNRKLYNANILFNLGIGIKDTNLEVAYPTINQIYYDFSDNNNYYNLALTYNNEENRNLLKKADVKILTEYGYSESEARKIVSSIYDMFGKIAKYSLLEENDDEKKLYSINELKAKYTNIDFDLIKNEFDYRFNSSSTILVIDESQLKLVNEYLVDDNLDTLKKYALVRLLYTYGDTINANVRGIINDLKCNMSSALTDSDENSQDTLIYDKINAMFSDTLAIEFAKNNSYDKLKPYYKDLINTYLQEYKKRIKSENWLSENTKNSAIKKIDKMGVNVLYPDNDKAIYYDATGNNIYEVDSNLNKTYNKYLFDNLKNYAVITNDWLDVNAFYVPSANLMLLEMGFVYAFNQALNIDINNINNYYYETLGGIGYTIGHELSHAFDNMGSKYDEYGKENDWWTDKDKITYNKLNLKVEKYYDRLNQDGYQTLGENIADLGGFSLTIQIAENSYASNDDFKKIFESAAKFDAMQSSSFVSGWLLLNDEHSPNRNRINGVYSSLDKFYEVYNIKETDKMYVKPSERVSVW